MTVNDSWPIFILKPCKNLVCVCTYTHMHTLNTYTHAHIHTHAHTGALSHAYLCTQYT